MSAQDLIRAALREIEPAAAHKAADSPRREQVYAPVEHGAALKFDRPLIVGNRGVGKSFWASVLASADARDLAAALYGLDELRSAHVELGFHEAAGMSVGPAPSPASLEDLTAKGFSSAQIWKAILLRALSRWLPESVPSSLSELLKWCVQDIERMEAALRHADAALQREGKRFLLVFDALDRLALDWPSIREQTAGVLRFALDVRGYRAIRAKVFLRSDQWRDDALFRFADASKLRSERVELVWRQRDLYGLVYQYLWSHPRAGQAFRDMVSELLLVNPTPGSPLPAFLRTNEGSQERVFTELAGEFMGSNSRRGRTYNWLHDHLADASGQTSPRSFQIALQSAAQSVAEESPRVLDHLAIKNGVQDASDVRVEQLNEDYPWMKSALDALENLEVPTHPDTFISRWRDRDTVRRILDLASARQVDAPVEFAPPSSATELGILNALKGIGVIEERSESRINMPDIFRVAAKLKRRGGVRVPSPRK